MKTIFLVVLCSVLSSSLARCQDEEVFDKFNHRTLLRDSIHNLVRSAVVCEETEFPDTRTFTERRYHISDRVMKIRIITVFHGISQPQVVFHEEKGSAASPVRYAVKQYVK